VIQRRQGGYGHNCPIQTTLTTPSAPTEGGVCLLTCSATSTETAKGMFVTRVGRYAVKGLLILADANPARRPPINPHRLRVQRRRVPPR